MIEAELFAARLRGLGTVRVLSNQIEVTVASGQNLVLAHVAPPDGWTLEGIEGKRPFNQGEFIVTFRHRPLPLLSPVGSADSGFSDRVRG